MRIISGKFKSRTLKRPKGIRPTQQKIRKAVFDILGDSVQGASFLELFSGSGAVGIEALSYGAKTACFVEKDNNCLRWIRQNLEALQIRDFSILAMEAEAAVKLLSSQSRKFDIIFLDPPYHADAAKKTLITLADYDILSPNGLIVVQHFRKDLLPQEAGFFRLLSQKKYGDTILTFYKKSEARNPKSETIFQ